MNFLMDDIISFKRNDSSRNDWRSLSRFSKYFWGIFLYLGRWGEEGGVSHFKKTQRGDTKYASHPGNGHKER